MSKSGRGSRARAKRRRDAQKRQRREANRARYAALAGTAANRKKKGRKKAGSSRRNHPVSPCGNGACRRCYSTAANNPWLAERGSCLYGKRWTSPKWRNA